MKKLILTSITFVVILIAVFVFLYLSIPHDKPTPIADLLKNSESFRNQNVMIKGAPVILSSVITKYGKYSFFAIKDATGQIPVSRDINDFDLDNTIGIVGSLGDVCVHAIANETSGKWSCDKKQIGIVT